MPQTNIIYQQMVYMQELSNNIDLPWESILRTNPYRDIDFNVFTKHLELNQKSFDLYRTLIPESQWKPTFDSKHIPCYNIDFNDPEPDPMFYDLYSSLILDGSANNIANVRTEEKKDAPQHISNSSRIDTIVSARETTSAYEISSANEKFMLYLDCQTKDFINKLLWTDFEDGIENDITRLFNEYLEQNRYVTYCWLNKIFSNNRTIPNITSKILHMLAMVVAENDYNYMMPVVTCGVSSQHPEDQEAAIMVIEKWRTKECLDAMQNTTYGSDWVKEYAFQVIAELKKELGVC